METFIRNNIKCGDSYANQSHIIAQKVIEICENSYSKCEDVDMSIMAPGETATKVYFLYNGKNYCYWNFLSICGVDRLDEYNYGENLWLIANSYESELIKVFKKIRFALHLGRRIDEVIKIY